MILNEPFNTTYKKRQGVVRPGKTLNSPNIHKDNLRNVDTDKSNPSDYFYVRNAGRNERIEVDNILFVRDCDSYSQIITKESTLALTINMKNILDQIHSDKIVKCHPSFAVNTDRIRAFDDISIYVAHNEKVYELPLGVTHRKQLNAQLPELKS